MIDWVAEPWTSGLVARAGLALIAVGLLGGLVGVFVVIRGLAFTTEAFAHTAFPGAVLAVAAGGSLLLGSLVAVVVAAAAVAIAARGDRTSDDTAISVVHTGLFAMGALLLAALGPLDRDVTSFLFGSVLGVGTRELVAIAVGGALVLAVLWTQRRALIATSFDRESARALGVGANHVEMVLLIALAVTVVLLVQSVGNMLVVAMLVTPAATARLVTRRITSTVIAAVGFGVGAAVAGLYVSYYAGLAAGPAVVLTATALLIVVACARAIRGRLVLAG